MEPTDDKEIQSLEFVHRFGAVAGRKAARYRAARQQDESAALVNPKAAQLGQKIRTLRLEKGWTRQMLAAEAGVDYAQLVLLEHGLLDSADTLKVTPRVIAALGVATELVDARGEESGTVGNWFSLTAELDNKQAQSIPTWRSWGKKLLWTADFLFLAFVVWLFSRWTGASWLSWPNVWLTLTGGVFFLVGEKVAARYWELAGAWGDRAYYLPPGALKEQFLRQRNHAERRFRWSIGAGGLALLLVVGAICGPASNHISVKLLTTIAGAVLFSGYRILALAYWRDAVRWQGRVNMVLEESELRRAVRNSQNAFRLFWLCSLFALAGAGSILIALEPFPLVQMVPGLVLLPLVYLGIRFVTGRYYVDIAM